MKSINFELSSSIKYANGSGAEIECTHIELREPTGKVTSTCCAIEALIQSSVLKMAGILDNIDAGALEDAKKEKQENTEPDGEAMMTMAISAGVDMEKLIGYCCELFKSVAWMGGEKRITQARLDDMSHRDLKKMAGVYIANFIQS